MAETKLPIEIQVTKDIHDDYENYGKSIHVELYSNLYNEITLIKDEILKITAPKGKCTQAYIGDVFIANTLEDIFSQVKYDNVEPRANSKKDAMRKIEKYLGQKGEFSRDAGFIVFGIHEKKSCEREYNNFEEEMEYL